MATHHTTATDFGNEKQDVRYIERTDTSTESDLNLHKEHTLDGVDMNNTAAFKGDESDGKVVWTTRSIFAAIFLAALYTGSQIILYFTGGSIGFIVADLGLTSGSGWLPTANILAIAATCPFAGYLQDLFGKRSIALFGSLCICVGCALVGTGHNFAQLLAGMAISGVGAAIGELTGLAGLAEVVPVKHRGFSLAIVTAFVLPFCPYLMYVEMWSHHDKTVGWRWGPWCALIFNGIVGIGLAFTYFPHNHTRAEGFSHMAILKRIDFVGGALSIIGLTLFLVALQSGGYTHSWTSAYVLCTLLLGLALIAAWVVWESKFARHPMVPGELFKGQRIVGLAYGIAFVAGMSFFSVLNLFPVAFTSVYDPDPVQIGLKGLGPSFATALGAIAFNAALSAYPNRTREVLLLAVLMMTGFTGSLAVMTPENPKLIVALGSLATFGVGGVLVPAATVAMLVCPDALITTAAALSLSIRTVGGSIGYSIYYNVFANKLEKNLPAYVAEYAIKAGLPLASVETFVGLYLTAPAKLATTPIPGVTQAVLGGAAKGTQWAYSESLKYVWLTSIAFGSMAIVCTLLLPSTKKYQTNRVAVHL
ncbi:MFS general substrate transporter [Dothidotthia symphoricarpi CBS 119687]|uniref:MFS general substrate transporter n=1 Tax=Dothidotthia symphoricarpi CBS 119687 TaxID=1392245 RepID=A0A6A6AG89_9PLEO|nr:MFS general substrate transporter [Dothidotthia symphoricarpi CBS 119687]KAF2130586.1 MFS general substrate transporter [Dothidotthia symphoricarpi CBS 119687]